jgi:cytoskeleton protein RodZ
MSALENRRPAGETAGEPPGKRLAEARQAQNQTTAEVARQLKLSVWQVEALESGRYEQLPGPMFVRGFIRNYARLLRLDPNELLDAAGETLPQQAPPRERPPSHDIPFPEQRKPRWPLAAAGLIVVGVLVVHEFYWDQWVQPASPPGAAVTPSAQLEAVQLPDPAGTLAGTPGSAGRDTDTAGLPGAPEPASRVKSAKTAAVAPAPATAPRPGEKRVRLEFEEESWVEIRDRNEQVIFSRLNPPGTQQLVEGMPPFSVVVGNAQGVRLTYDGKPVDLALHTRIDVARLVLR